MLGIKRAFGSRTFTPKDLHHEMDMARAPATRLIGRLSAAGILARRDFSFDP